MIPRVDVVNTCRAHRVDAAAVRRYVRGVFRRERQSAAAITVIFIDSRRSRRMNREYLRHDYPTDVISFPLEEGENLEAEIYVNLERARTQARQHGVSMPNEVARLVIHGTLHLAGYDDSRPDDARKMHERQEAYVGAFVKKTRQQNVR
jgi:probable rRNA maturation factor